MEYEIPVLAQVERTMASTFKDVDRMPLPSDDSIPHWRNTAQWARRSLVTRGMLKPV